MAHSLHDLIIKFLMLATSQLLKHRNTKRVRKRGGKSTEVEDIAHTELLFSVITLQLFLYQVLVHHKNSTLWILINVCQVLGSGVTSLPSNEQVTDLYPGHVIGFSALKNYSTVYSNPVFHCPLSILSCIVFEGEHCTLLNIGPGNPPFMSLIVYVWRRNSLAFSPKRKMFQD